MAAFITEVTSGLVMRKLMTVCIKGYQLLVSPFIGNNCRFYPSCSCYAEESIEQYGVLKGGYLTLRRLIKCHPYHAGGYDPVPQPQQKTELK